MKKLVLLCMCAFAAFAADNQVRIEGVFVSDKIAHVQANGVRFTDTIDTKKQGLMVELRTEMLQDRNTTVKVFTNNVQTGTKVLENVPSYASASLVKQDIVKLSPLSVGAKVGYKQLFGPNSNAALLVFEPRARLDMGAATLRFAYEMNNSFDSNRNIKFNAKKVAVDYKLLDMMGLTVGYEDYRGYIKRAIWTGGLVFQF